MNPDHDETKPSANIIRLIGDAMHFAAYYESAKTGGRKMAAYVRMQNACRELLEQLLSGESIDRELDYLLRRGQCNTHEESEIGPSQADETCYDCDMTLPAGTPYWCLSIQEETEENGTVSVHDAMWLRKWCHQCADKLAFENLIVPLKSE